ncbi:hypothetical protein [Janthinobacterium fluminis]|uniref:Uncharacterized protein n=1 Tax=Janthinobacterium fluminis TaxID=2987524 RepID=A0ABT5JZS0_9BURK|nr:hypothetical protein [Janthinobacterium fluminis]MDC8758228.1 hypothetical protein [Janthinobacterium fluminis]
MTRLIRIALTLLLLSITTIASATNYTLWINGRNGKGTAGDYASFTYWGPAATAAGVNKKAVNWDGYNSISSQNGKIRDALDCFCTGPNWCYVATHSAGDFMMAYTMANYGGSSRLKKNASPGSGGVCGNTDGSSQVGWNIKWVRAASGAAGGSELSDIGSDTTSEPLVKDLKTTTARAMFNHNETRNVWFYMYPGGKGTLYSFVLPGQDDQAIAYHSSGGVSGAAGQALCNPGDSCPELTMGSGANANGSTKWSYHSVEFRDTKEQYDHYSNGNWQGIISVVRGAVVNSAR